MARDAGSWRRPGQEEASVNPPDPDERSSRSTPRTRRRGEHPQLQLVAAATIPPRSVRWAWRNRIPLGTLTGLAGQPGLGKTTIALDIAAQASRGELDGDLWGPPADVIIATAEDSLETTLRPRLELAGADLERIYFVMVGDGGSFSLPRDLDRLEELLAAGPRARLLVIDPLMGHLDDGTDSHKEHPVRRALGPLSSFAEGHDLAIVAILHMNKGEMDDLLRRVGGSIGIVAACRSVLVVAAHPGANDRDERVLVDAKGNLAPLTSSLRYRMEDGTILGQSGETIHAARVQWGPEEPDVNRYNLLVRAGGRPKPPRHLARDFLRSALGAGPRLGSEVQAEAEEVGISARTLDRAKADEHIESVKEDFQGPWNWRLPTESEDSTSREEWRPSSADEVVSAGHHKGRQASQDWRPSGAQTSTEKPNPSGEGDDGRQALTLWHPSAPPAERPPPEGEGRQQPGEPGASPSPPDLGLPGFDLTAVAAMVTQERGRGHADEASPCCSAPQAAQHPPASRSGPAPPRAVRGSS